METMLLDNEIFVFKFSCSEDKLAVLEGGPWNFGKVPMIVRS